MCGIWGVRYERGGGGLKCGLCAVGNGFASCGGGDDVGG